MLEYEELYKRKVQGGARRNNLGFVFKTNASTHSPHPVYFCLPRSFDLRGSTQELRKEPSTKQTRAVEMQRSRTAVSQITPKQYRGTPRLT